MIRLAPLALLLFAIAVPAATAASAPQWQSYTNVRFNYHACYPADRLKAQPEADNGDGRRFTGTKGSVLLVLGSYNAMDQSLPEAHRQQRADYSKQGQVSYDRAAANWFVLSGTSSDMVFYRKTMLVKDRWLVMELRYPRAGAASWTPIVAHLSRCFGPTDGSNHG